MTRHALLLAVVMALPGLATAQQPEPAPPSVPGIVRHGKWAAAALFVAATGVAVFEHRGANGAFDDLRSMCGASVQCSIGQDGRYTDAVAEAQYQEVVAGDRAARAWFIAGQAALAGAAVLFVIELRHPKGSTNIPYSGFVVKPTRFGTHLGWRTPIRLP